MIQWKYNATQAKEEDEKRNYVLIPVGNHRVRVENVEAQTSKTGKDMWKFTFQVSGYNGKLFYYMVFNPENSGMTNRNLMNLWDSFGLQEGDMNESHFLGKVGAVKVKHEQYNGDMTAKVSYVLKKKDQRDLPPWKEPGTTQAANPLLDDTDFAPIDDDDLPF